MSLNCIPLPNTATGGAVGGASSLTTVGAVTFVSPAGSITQDASNFFWDATNHRLGIGTNSPLWNLTVKGNDIMLTNDGTTGAQFTVASSQAYLRTNTTYPLNLGTNSATYIRIASTGPVGIGPSNTSPTGTLHVYDATASTGVTTLTVKAGAGQSSTNLFEVQSNAGTVLSGFAPGGDLFFTSSTSSSDVRISRVAVGTATAMAAILRGDAGDYGRLYLKSMQAQATTGIAGLIGWGTTPGTYTTALSEISAGIVGVGTGAAGSTAGQLRATSVATVALTVATLPATPIAGQRAFVTDSNAASYTAGIGAIVAAGGTTACPVVYDGTNWRIG